MAHRLIITISSSIDEISIIMKPHAYNGRSSVGQAASRHHHERRLADTRYYNRRGMRPYEAAHLGFFFIVGDS